MASAEVSSQQDLGLLARLAARANGFVRQVGAVTATALLPSSGPVAKATAGAAKATGEGAKAIATSTAGVLDSAAKGVKTGLGFGVFFLILIAGLYLIGLFRNATGD